VSARHQVKRLDRTFDGLHAQEADPAEETSFFVRCGPNLVRSFILGSCEMKFGPDVFADALVHPAGVSSRLKLSPTIIPISSDRRIVRALRGVLCRCL
jgi:hypothetical protein